MAQAPTPPSSGESLDIDTLKGVLLYVTVLERLDEIQTKFGPARPVRCNVAELDGNNKGTEHEDVLIFPKRLVSQLAPAVGTADPNVVGRLTKVAAGDFKAWELSLPDVDDMAIAAKWEAALAKRRPAPADDEPF